MNLTHTNIDAATGIDNINICGNDKDVEQKLTVPLQQHYPLTQNHYDMSKTAVKKSKQKIDVYEKATEKIIALLEKGEVAWRRTWGTYGLARNFKTNHVYTGVNLLFMNFFSEHPIPLYLTFRQAKELGGNIKRGAKAEFVYFYKGYYKDEKGNNVSEVDANSSKYDNAALTPVRFLKSYPVFNIEDTEGFDWERPQEAQRSNKPIEECETIIQEMNEQPTFKLIDANQAFYDPMEDIVNVPDIKQFENSEFFYRTTFHEIAHWTGHATRLSRTGVTEPIVQGSDQYAEEELIAELASNYLLHIAGISTNDSMEVSAGYLKSWIARLKEDPRILFRIAPKAQEATEFILGKSITELEK